jgi:dUTPase
MKIQVLKNESYKSADNLPKKGTDRATGFDIIAVSDPEIVGELNPNNSYKKIDYIQYKTNLKVAVRMEQSAWHGVPSTYTDYDILAFPRSSISKYNLVLANSIGLIDADYRGEVLLRFKYIWQPEDYGVYTYESGDQSSPQIYIGGSLNSNKIYKKGDKICQLKVTKVENVEFILVDELDTTDRGEGGFGSTDVNNKQVKNITDLYEKINTNTVPVQKKYIDAIKEREQKIG